MSERAARSSPRDDSEAFLCLFLWRTPLGRCIIAKDMMVEVKDLKKRYGDKQAVDGVSFSVKKGEIFGILGPNGAGKTTTLEMMEALRPIDSGSVSINGIDVAKDSQKIKYLIGVQPQSPAFQDKTKLKEVIEMFAAAYGEKVDAMQFLRDVELEEKANSYVEDLSGGQKQRLSITTALVHGPKVFFLDEPTTGLDPQARRHLWDLIKQVRERGISVIMTTHYMDEAEILCDRIAIMDAGKIIAIDTPKNLVKALLKRGFTKKQQVEQANLEDVFIDLTGKDLREGE
ncbi:Nodulation ATP-binding protein I [Candidatus Saccharibacteria bacterium RAAC3_TM7_1]|nr:Nodulation ATP-binding protein I [Candidatus Saccharibacteria bacterium RAAC3_TM7_1]